MSSYYMTPPGPPPGRPPAEREPFPGPPPGNPPAEEAVNFVEPWPLPLTPTDLALCHPSRQTNLIRALRASGTAVLPVSENAEDAMPAYAAANDADGASEHVLLTLNDLPELRQHGRGLYGVLHNEARAFTDKFANVDYEAVGVQADLTTEWPNWKLYIANHKLAQELIGPGVKAFTVEFIDGTKDPNRGGRPRLDLVIRHPNNAYWRLHPGSAPKSDAIPRFFPGSAPEHAAYEPASAPEPAAYEWRRPGAAGIFSSDRAKLVPQIDRLSKADIWQAVQRIPQRLIPDVRSRAGLDITCGQHILWWLWICNLGNHTRFVIGAGVRAAHLTMDTNNEAVFKFTRIDGTECVVKLACMRRGQLQVYVPTEPAFDTEPALRC